MALSSSIPTPLLNRIHTPFRGFYEQMSENHVIGDEFLSAQIGRNGPETLPPSELNTEEEVEELINTLSPERSKMKFPMGKLTPTPAPISTNSDNELLQFRMMLVDAKSRNPKSTLRLDSMTPSNKPITVPLDMARRAHSPSVSNSRLTSMSTDNVAWERRQARLRDLKDLNLLLLGIAFGSVLLLAAVVLYMYIQH